MPFRLEMNICDDPFPNGSPTTIAEGRYGNELYQSASDCNMAASAALESWLANNCSDLVPDGVSSGTFEGDDSGEPT